MLGVCSEVVVFRHQRMSHMDHSLSSSSAFSPSFSCSSSCSSFFVFLLLLILLLLLLSLLFLLLLVPPLPPPPTAQSLMGMSSPRRDETPDCSPPFHLSSFACDGSMIGNQLITLSFKFVQSGCGASLRPVAGVLLLTSTDDDEAPKPLAS